MVLIPKTLNMTPGQLLELLHSGVPLSMYSDKMVILQSPVIYCIFVGIAKAALIQPNLLRSRWFVAMV